MYYWINVVCLIDHSTVDFTVVQPPVSTVDFTFVQPPVSMFVLWATLMSDIIPLWSERKWCCVKADISKSQFMIPMTTMGSGTWNYGFRHKPTSILIGVLYGVGSRTGKSELEKVTKQIMIFNHISPTSAFCRKSWENFLLNTNPVLEYLNHCLRQCQNCLKLCH